MRGRADIGRKGARRTRPLRHSYSTLRADLAKTPIPVPFAITTTCPPLSSERPSSSEKPQSLSNIKGKSSSVIGFRHFRSTLRSNFVTVKVTSVSAPAIVAPIIGPPNVTALLPIVKPTKGVKDTTKNFFAFPIFFSLIFKPMTIPQVNKPAIIAPETAAGMRTKETHSGEGINWMPNILENNGATPFRSQKMSDHLIQNGSRKNGVCFFTSAFMV